VQEIKKMLQRIQTIYLLLAFIATGVLPFFIPLWTMNDGKEFLFMQNQVYVALLGLSTTLTLVSIVSYKKRQNQFVMGRLNMILNLILLGLFVYRSLNVSGETPAVSEKGIGMFLPIVAIVLLVLANKAIKKDEDLVKSVDRLR
jgi:4-amino-4-deoxy-L-arabinose transferase-like glycosyltransferase